MKSLVIITALIAGIFGLINPNFTPIHLEDSSTAIVAMRVGPISATGEIPVKTLRVLKGGDPGITGFSGDPAHANYRTLDAMVGQGADALLFMGAQGDKGPKNGGMVLIDHRWFQISGEGKTRDIAKENDDFETVWNGSAEMLERGMRYLMADPTRARFPAIPNARWKSALEPLVLGGAVDRLLPLIGDDGRSAGLLGLGAGGDRLITVSSVTPLASKTAGGHGLLMDCDGDGLADLVSWTGTDLRVFKRTAQGFSSDSEHIGPCAALAGLAAWRCGAKAGVLQASATGLTVFQRSGTTWTSTALPALPATVGAGGPVAVADIDADGFPDAVQICPQGVVVWRGGAAGLPTSAAVACAGAMLAGPTQVEVTDHDQDGLPDLAAIGSERLVLLRNLGNGRFSPSIEHAGEAAEKSSGAFTSLYAGDFDHDGRPDLAMGRSAPATPDEGQRFPLFFFNRGFNSFGTWMAETSLASDISANPAFVTAFSAGSRALLIEDTDHDGAPDIAWSDADNRLWRVASLSDDGGTPTLSITAPASWTTPVLITAMDGKRQLGCRWLVPGNRVTFCLERKGPIQLRWKDQSGKDQTKTMPLLKPTSFVLP